MPKSDSIHTYACDVIDIHTCLSIYTYVFQLNIPFLFLYIYSMYMYDLFRIKLHFQNNMLVGGVWVTQSVKHPALDFGTGHNLTVVGSSSMWGSMLRVGPA